MTELSSSTEGSPADTQAGSVRQVAAGKQDQGGGLGQATTDTGRWLSGVLAILGIIIFLVLLWNVFFNFDERGQILKEHFSAIVGIPVAAGTALIVVASLRFMEGQIEIEVSDRGKFKGATVPIIMWLLCFLAITGGIKWLW